MTNAIKDFFLDNNIEFFASIPISKCQIIMPHKLPSDAKSVLLWLMPYYCGDEEKRNISLYAISEDYHIFAKEMSDMLISVLKNEYSQSDFYGFSDNSPISEVSAAVKTGLGYYGENHLLQNVKYGSYIFIASVISSVDIDISSGNLKENMVCAGCGKCIAACPTKALSEGEIKSFCRSALTQKKSLTPDELCEVLSLDCIWGCDVCQNVCPANKNVPQTPIEFFHKNRTSYLTKELIEKMSDVEFSRRAYSWRGKEVILRNLRK